MNFAKVAVQYVHLRAERSILGDANVVDADPDDCPTRRVVHVSHRGDKGVHMAYRLIRWGLLECDQPASPCAAFPPAFLVLVLYNLLLRNHISVRIVGAAGRSGKDG